VLAVTSPGFPRSVPSERKPIKEGGGGALYTDLVGRSQVPHTPVRGLGPFDAFRPISSGFHIAFRCQFVLLPILPSTALFSYCFVYTYTPYYIGSNEKTKILCFVQSPFDSIFFHVLLSNIFISRAGL
jgi:hypothetical protein